MPDYDAEIRKLEQELSTTKYNKRTQHHIGLVKAKLARLKEKQEVEKKARKKGAGYAIRRSGDATVIIVGFPSVGKSTLLNALTNAKSKIADYAFTTLTVIPGILEYEHARIQILDVPGIMEGANDGTGRGREVLAVLQAADMALILVDIAHPEQLRIILDELRKSNIRINKHRPDVRLRKTVKNGIRIGKTVRLPLLPDDTIKAILKEFRINNAEVLIREEINDDELIDVIEANRIYMPAVIALSKADVISLAEAQRIKEQSGADVFISAEKMINLEELKKLIFSRMELVRIYLKQPGKEADFKEPLIVRGNATIRAVCEKLHRDFISKFRFARIWGPSSRFPGQKILSLNHVLRDNDVLEIHLR